MVQDFVHPQYELGLGFDENLRTGSMSGGRREAPSRTLAEAEDARPFVEAGGRGGGVRHIMSHGSKSRLPPGEHPNPY